MKQVTGDKLAKSIVKWRGCGMSRLNIFTSGSSGPRLTKS